MKINRNLLPLKGHYFFKNAAAASIIPFVPIIAKNLGFTGKVLRSVTTAVPLLSILSKPIAGAIADKFHAHKFLYIFFLVVNLAFVVSIKFLPSMTIDTGVTLRCHDTSDIVVSTMKAQDECFVKRLRLLLDNTPLSCQMNCNHLSSLIDNLDHHQRKWDEQSPTSQLSVGVSFPLVKESNQIYLKLDYINVSGRNWLEPSCPIATEWPCQMQCMNPMIQDIIAKPSIRDSSIYTFAEFWIFAIVLVCARGSARNLSVMGDTIGLKLLGNNPQHIGVQMLWGGLAWGLVSVGTGYLADHLSKTKSSLDFTYAYIAFVGFFLMNLVSGICFNIEETPESGKSTGVYKVVTKHILGSPKFLVFLVWVVACGAGSALIWNYLSLFLMEMLKEDRCTDLTWVTTMNGLMLAVQIFLGEIPFFFISGRMLESFGHATCMTIVLLGFSARFILYCLLTSPWWVLPVEILNGVTYSVLQSTMVTYANALAPSGAEATVQGIVSATFDGIGVPLGLLVGGHFIDSWGVRSVFFIGGLVSAVLAVLHSLISAFWLKLDRPHYDDRKLPPEQFEEDPDDLC